MNIFSLWFIIFLTATFLVYYLVSLINRIVKKQVFPQWVILLIGSLVFYGFSNYVYLIYLGISSTVSFLVSLLCQYKLVGRKNNKLVFKPCPISEHISRIKYENFLTAVAIIINVGILAVLKYFNFFIGSVNSLFHLNIAAFNFIIPLGISFYTFSLIAYNVDCCRRVTVAEHNPFKFLLFVSYFPKILQGPISSYDRLKEDGLFKGSSFIDVNYLNSFFRISVGLIKKIAIANVLNLYINSTFNNLSDIFGWGLLLTCLLYSIQLYCDFSGFIDIAIGISGLFGIKLEENFNAPYLSDSIQDFWRRWHITLGNWLRKYIYIPLGGNRVPIWRWIINIFIVWLISGIWHGANWTFVIWGLFHGALIVISGIGYQIKKKKSNLQIEKKDIFIKKIFKIGITFALVSFGWIFFRASDVIQAGTYFYHMIFFWKTSSYNVFTDATLTNANIFFIFSFVLLAVLILIYVLSSHKTYFSDKIKSLGTVSLVSKYVVTIFFVTISIFSFIYLNSLGVSESTFIYFDF